MSILEAIKTRRSVRSFDGNPLTPEDRKKIIEFAEGVNNPYGQSIAWKLLDGESAGLSSPVILGSDLYIAGKMKKASYAEEAFGYAFEKIVLYAESLGIGTTWIAGTMNREAFEKAMDLADDEVMPCVSPLGYPGKMSLRETLMRKGVKADSRLPFSELFFDESFDAPLSPEKAGKLAEVLEAVRLAPSAVNKQPWRIVISDSNAHFYEKRSKGLASESGWDVQKIDMGIALAHFDLASKELGIDTVFEIKDPGLPTPQDTFYIASYQIKQNADMV